MKFKIFSKCLKKTISLREVGWFFPKSSLFALLLFIAVLVPQTLHAMGESPMESAFRSRNWGTMDSLYGGSGARSEDSGLVASRDQSLYLNALWIQGKYSEGVDMLERMLRSEDVEENFPADIRPYASMLLVLGEERTGRKNESFENGRALWETAPGSLKYYLAYALARVTRDLGRPDESIEWFRRMLDLAPDKKRRLQALNQMIELPGVAPDEAAALLIDAPSNARALALCGSQPKGSRSLVDYAVGYNDYINKRYEPAMERFDLASGDMTCGEAARYYGAYSAFRLNKNSLALSLWSDVALAGNEYPQRSVQRLTTLAGRGMREDVLEVFRKVSESRDDYPDLAADALAGIIRLGETKEAATARDLLYAKHPKSSQAATARWDMGWKAWKEKDYKTAYEQWSSGYVPGIKNKELGARLLYWQSRALEKLGSPVAAERVKLDLTELYPAEYHAFLVSPNGGIKSADVPTSYDRGSILEDWGFVTYARLEGMDAPPEKPEAPDVPALFRSVRLALWEGDFSSAVRGFSALQRAIPASDYASSCLLRYNFPRAFEQDVVAASKQTGVETAVIWGVMRQESLYEPDVTSSAGAYGLMQLMPATARGEEKKMNLSQDSYKQPTSNILLGANHLVGLFARFKETSLSLAAYNAGGVPVTKWSREPITDMAEWVEDIAYAETRGYVKAVLRNIGVYRRLYPLGKDE
ncbi:MAG: lytic transglycosylase domain-containing protein [Synergistaceae bacterium]|nr:lytic transglycosylase domain-containing protein [Synergistaceae bacterium]